MKTIIFLFFIINVSVANSQQLDCPNLFTLNNTQYCLKLKWNYAEYKFKNQVIPSDYLSPVIIAPRTPSAQKNYSKVQIFIWEKNDLEKVSLNLNGFRAFPYMHMLNGHHHSVSKKSYQFAWQENLQSYELSGLAFISMPGCWSITWNWNQEKNSINESSQFVPIMSFENLNEQQNTAVSKNCHELHETTANPSEAPSSKHNH